MLRLLSLGFAVLPGAALAAACAMKPVVIPGAAQVFVTAINNKDTIAGTLQDANGPEGFVRIAGQVTILPPFCPTTVGECVPIPSVVNAKNIVGGNWNAGPYSYYGFAWQSGSYLSGFHPSLGGPGPLLERYPGDLRISNDGFVSYNIYSGDFPSPYGGTLASQSSLPQKGSGATVLSVNNLGDFAGSALNPGKIPEVIPEAFLLTPKYFKFLLPPGGQNSSGGLVNDHQQVAGLWSDAKNVSHGFLWSLGRYTAINPPGRPASLIVQSINQSGRVLGTYVDTTTNTQKVFIFEAGRTRTFGAFDPSAFLSVSQNDAGVIMIGELSTTTQSWRVICKPSGP